MDATIPKSPLTRRTTVRRAALVWLAVLVVLVPGTSARSDEAESLRLVLPDGSAPVDHSIVVEEGPCERCGAEDELWLISSRGAPSCGNLAAGVDRLRYWQAGTDCRWTVSSLPELLATDHPTIPTIVWIHGNQVEPDGAIEMGTAWYRQLRRTISGPLRFVIWSWPSQRTSRKLRDDSQLKAARSEAHGYYLAAVAAQLQPETPIVLIGYSYGARFVTSSLHLLGGGRIGAWELETPRVGRPMRGVLLAAALDSDWLAPGRRYGEALHQVDELLILLNSCDPALRFYPLLCPQTRPVALGREGVWSWSQLGDQRYKVTQRDVSGVIGRHHDWRRYATSGYVLRMIGERCSFDDTPEAIWQLTDAAAP